MSDERRRSAHLVLGVLILIAFCCGIDRFYAVFCNEMEDDDKDECGEIYDDMGSRTPLCGCKQWCWAPEARNCPWMGEPDAG